MLLAYDGNKESGTYGKIVEVIASEERSQIVKVFGHYWHGTKTIGSEPSLILYLSTSYMTTKVPNEEGILGMILLSLILKQNNL